MWEFEVRVCDATGGAVPLNLASPTPDQVPPPQAEPEQPKKEGK